MSVNGKAVRFGDVHETAAVAIRTELGLTGTKLACGTGVCGACTILVNGVAVAGCLLPVEDLEDAEVTTIEGIGVGDGLHPVQAAFIARDGLQCGYCTPGFVVEAVAFYERWRAANGSRRPERDDIARALAGHLCRCGAYPGIYEAVAAACAGEFDHHRADGPRVDALEKVTGSARYTTDIHLDALIGRVIRSGVAHGELVSVDPTAALALPGVQAFVMLAEPGDRVRYHGQPVAALAARDLPTARAAVGLVEVAIKPLPQAVGAKEALADGAPDVHGWWIPPSSNEGPSLPNFRRKNLVGPIPVGTTNPFAVAGRLRKARKDEDPLLVEDRWSTPVLSHTSLEPHAAVAAWDRAGNLELHLSTQAVSESKRIVAKRLGIDPERVTVIADHIGGGFGSKGSPGTAAIAAARLARAASRPVRVVFDRAEELAVGGNRPGAEMELAVLGSTSGPLRAIRMEARGDGGAAAGSVVASFLPRVVYPGAPRTLLDYDVVSNAPPGKPFRAPGGPVALFALEQAVNELAERMGADPVELRRSWNERPLRSAMYDWVDSNPLWQQRGERGSGRRRRGVGVAFGTWFTGHDPKAKVTVSAGKEGIRVHTGAQDMGNGTRTALAAAVADAFGVERSAVAVVIGNSELGHGPTSAGSRTTATVWPTAHAAAGEVIEGLADQARRQLGLTGATAVTGGLVHAGEELSWPELLPRLEQVTVTKTRPRDPQRLVPFQLSVMGMEASRGFSESAVLVQVEVDSQLGSIRVLRAESAIAAGKIHTPALARSQVYGGMIQGLSMTFHEQRLLDHPTGAVLTANLEDYHLIGIGDTPLMEVSFVETGFEHVAGGGVGLAELALVAVPAAAADAVADATGRRFRHLPILPGDVIGPH